MKEVSGQMQSLSGNLESIAEKSAEPFMKLAEATKANIFTDALDVLNPQKVAGIIAQTEAIIPAALSMSAPIVELTKDIPGLTEDLVSKIEPSLKDAVTALQSSADEVKAGLETSVAGIAEDGFLHEIMTIGTPEAIAETLKEITGKSLPELEGVLKEIGLPELANEILPGVEELTEKFEVISQIAPKLQSEFTKLDKALENIVPNLSGAVVDDLIRNIDLDIINDLQSVFSFSQFDQLLKNDVLKSLINNDLQNAIEVVQIQNLTKIIENNPLEAAVKAEIEGLINRGAINSAISKVTELNLDTFTGILDPLELEKKLSAIVIDPMEILGATGIPANVRQIIGGVSSWKGGATKIASEAQSALGQPKAGNTTKETQPTKEPGTLGATRPQARPEGLSGQSDTFAFDFVDTAEEFEADIASSTRDLTTLVHHYIDVPAGEKVSSESLHKKGSDGMDFHYLILTSGRVQRGRPISSASLSGADKIDIAFVNKKLTTEQHKTYKEIMKAIVRIIPGIASLSNEEKAANLAAQQAAKDGTFEGTGEEARAQDRATGSTSQPPGNFNTSVVNNCLVGPRFNGDAGLGPDAFHLPPAEPGVSTTHTLTPLAQRKLLNEPLPAIIEAAAAKTGLTPVITSGRRYGSGLSSGRHGGWASDTQLRNGDRVLSVMNAQDQAQIKAFVEAFVSEAASRGYFPSVGVANSAYPNTLYMGGTSHHFDIARGQPGGIGIGRGKLWGGSGARSRHVPPPPWLGPIMAGVK